MSGEHSIGHPFTQLNEVDSTNNYAMAQAQAHLAGHGATWFAHSQYSGRGQRGNAWLTAPGSNIIISTIIEPFNLSLNRQFDLSMAVALGCADFFTKYALDDTKIKWPNDIYWKDRKAGGILIENVLQGNSWKYAIAGIGININQTSFSPDLPNPVSLKQITGKTFDVVELAKELCRFLDARWKQLQAGEGELMLDDYNKYLYKTGETVSFKKESAVFNATVQGVNRNGELKIFTSTETSISFGEAEWLVGYSKQK